MPHVSFLAVFFFDSRIWRSTRSRELEATPKKVTKNCQAHNIQGTIVYLAPWMVDVYGKCRQIQLIRLSWGWVISYMSPIHTAYIGEDSSILAT